MRPNRLFLLRLHQPPIVDLNRFVDGSGDWLWLRSYLNWFGVERWNVEGGAPTVKSFPASVHVFFYTRTINID
jgi:hypothetical protein